MQLEVDPDSTRVLDRLIDRSQRTSGARLPVSFARRPGGNTSLSSLIQGGRGGDVRLKLYLSTVLLAGGSHDHPVHGKNAVVDVSGANWARALALPDPAGAGARRIADAQDQLASRRLIELERRRGQAPKVQLLHASGSGGPWAEPGSPYLRVPLELWSNRWIWCLSGKELAVFLAVVDLCGGEGRDRSGGPQSLTGEQLRDYGMSPDTWRIATAQLEAYGLAETDFDVVRYDLESPRRRKRYQLIRTGLAAQAPIAGVGAR